jgi:hypothetical protein
MICQDNLLVVQNLYGDIIKGKWNMCAWISKPMCGHESEADPNTNEFLEKYNYINILFFLPSNITLPTN